MVQPYAAGVAPGAMIPYVTSSMSIHMQTPFPAVVAVTTAPIAVGHNHVGPYAPITGPCLPSCLNWPHQHSFLATPLQPTTTLLPKAIAFPMAGGGVSEVRDCR